MKKLIAVIALAVSVLTFGGIASPVQAGNNCSPEMSAEVCVLFLKQQQAPALHGPQAPTTEPMRCVFVASNEPTALVLRTGEGVDGEALTSWRKSVLNWKDGKVKGRAVKLAQICFPVRLLLVADAVTLCGEIGHSIWRNENMKFVRKNDVDRFDPACVGGKGWCSSKGL